MNHVTYEFSVNSSKTKSNHMFISTFKLMYNRMTTPSARMMTTFENSKRFVRDTGRYSLAAWCWRHLMSSGERFIIDRQTCRLPETRQFAAFRRNADASDLAVCRSTASSSSSSSAAATDVPCKDVVVTRWRRSRHRMRCRFAKCRSQM